MHKIYMVMSQDKNTLISLDTHMLRLEKIETYSEGTKWQFRVKTPYYGCTDTLLASYSLEEKARKVMSKLVDYFALRDVEYELITPISSVFEFPSEDQDLDLCIRIYDKDC